MTKDKAVPAPTDAQVIRTFIEESAEIIHKSEHSLNLTEVERAKMRGRAAAREELDFRLNEAKVLRQQAVEDAADRLAQAAAEVGKRLADSLKSWHQKAEERSER
jgi:hypothetical protein